MRTGALQLCLLGCTGHQNCLPLTTTVTHRSRKSERGAWDTSGQMHGPTCISIELSQRCLSSCNVYHNHSKSLAIKNNIPYKQDFLHAWNPLQSQIFLIQNPIIIIVYHAGIHYQLCIETHKNSCIHFISTALHIKKYLGK